MTFYKLWTHDFCSPLQGGKPVWDGSLPFDLPTVKLDTGEEECSHGWNFTEDLAKGFQIAGMWPNGRPSCVTIIEPSKDLIQRGNKWRSSGGKIVRFATEVEIAQGVESFSKIFVGFEKAMTGEQLAWRYALSRPESNEKAIVEALEKALEHRGLKWTVKKYETARDAWAAWAARDAWAAWAALTVFFAGQKGWTKDSADLLTVGLRDAYANGMEIALPTTKNTLGYAVKP